MLFASMLFATWFSDQFGTMIIWLIVFLTVVFHCGKKFGDANPVVKDAAKKAAASKAIQVIEWLFKKK